MKVYLTSILKVIILFFAPIKPLIILISLSTIIDTAFGIWIAKQLNEKITSKIFRNGLVPKLISYITTIMMVYGSDVFIINELTMSVVDVEFLATKITALTLISIEVKSMDESFIAVKGYSFIDKFKQMISKIKDVKKQL